MNNVRDIIDSVLAMKSYGGLEAQVHSLLTWELDVLEGLAERLDDFSPRKSLPIQDKEEALFDSKVVLMVWEIFVSACNRNTILQLSSPQPTYCTEYAIRSPKSKDTKIS